MLKFFSALCLALFFLSIAPVGQVEAAEVHPWDKRGRRERAHRNDFLRFDPNDYIYYTRDRAITHALHPYYRHRYHELHKLSSLSRRSYRTFYSFPQGQSMAYLCNNYSFNRPNYRVPPYGYHCED